MKGNAGIKIVAGFFISVGILLLLIGIGLALLFLFPPQILLFTRSLSDSSGPDFMIFVTMGVLITLFSTFPFLVANGLHNLRSWAYKGAFVLIGLFLLFAIFILFSDQELLYVSMTVFIINVVASIILFTNRSLFKDP